jgi:hypothetical protein
VSFGVDVVHDGCNIDLNLDGKKWNTIKPNMAAPSRQTYSYKWIMGQDTSSRGKIRICQKSGSVGCTDADTIDAPGGTQQKPVPYVLISAPFSIKAPTTALSRPEKNFTPSLRAVGTGSLELTFSLPSEGPVSLIAYNAQGRVAATLLQKRYSASVHKLSLYSEALRSHPDWILRLKVGSQAQALRP